MDRKMINELSIIGTNVKLFLATTALAGVVVAEAVIPQPTALSEYTAQAALVAALCFVVRYLIASMKEHREDMAKTRDGHESTIRKMHEEHVGSAIRREDMMRGALEANALTTQELVRQSAEQTDYFREVTQAALNSKLSPK